MYRSIYLSLSPQKNFEENSYLKLKATIALQNIPSFRISQNTFWICCKHYLSIVMDFLAQLHVISLVRIWLLSWLFKIYNFFDTSNFKVTHLNFAGNWYQYKTLWGSAVLQIIFAHEIISFTVVREGSLHSDLS